MTEALKRLGFLLSAMTVLLLIAHLPEAASRPTSQPTTRPAVKFTVVTYNINYGNANLKEVVKTIRKADADLLCLQETNRQSEAYLRRAFRRKYRYMYFRHGHGAGGFGIMSKSPLKNVRYLPRKHGPFGTLLFQTKLAGKEVQVVNVHLVATVPRRNEGLGGLLKLFWKTEAIRAREIKYIHDNLPRNLPIILLGDFNSPPYMTVPRFLAERGFIDGFAAVTPDADEHVTWHWRYKNVEWRFRLDYIFHNKYLKTISSRIIQSSASDHYLVTAAMRWASPSTTKPASDSRPKPERGQHPRPRTDPLVGAIGLAKAYRDAGMTEKARAILTEALKQYPDSPSADRARALLDELK